MKKLMLPLIIGLVMLVVGVVLGKVLFTADAATAVEEEPVIEQTPPGILELETFLANINDPDGERYAKLQLRLAIIPKERVAAIEGDTRMIARMRDRVLTLLTSKTFDELSDPLGKEGFRNEIRMRLAPLIEEGEIREVLFNEFVVQ